MKFLMVYMTAKDAAEARAIGKALLTEKLAACINILDGMNSLYVWKGRFCDERESVIIAKTRSSLLPRLVRRVKQLHSYEVPCVVALPIVGGNGDFLAWVGKNTDGGRIAVRKRRAAKSSG